MACNQESKGEESMSSGPQLRLLAACRKLVLYRRQDAQVALVALRLWAIPTRSRGLSSWFYPLLAFLLARRDALLTVSLKAGRCEGILCDLALVFFAGERLKDGELLEDNS